MDALLKRLISARRVSVPIVGVTSADQFAFCDLLRASINGGAALVRQDIVRGVCALNETGESAVSEMLSGADPTAAGNPTDCLTMAAQLPAGSIIIMMNAHRWVNDRADAAQAILNLRDQFKVNQRMLILCAPLLSLPLELQSDVILLDEPLPERSQISSIVRDLMTGADLPYTDEVVSAASDALVGLAAFPAEQSAAMALSKTGLSVEDCWERKRKQVEQVKGIRFSRSEMRFSDLGGLGSIKDFAQRYFSGPRKPKCVVWLDEIEKSMAGAGAAGGAGDNTGVSQDFNGVILREMENNGWTGIILLGPPGSGKSAFCQALGGEFDVPLISLDLGAMKGSLLGESEAAIRTAMKTILAIGGKDVFFAATCNKLDSLPPELRRRFRYGLWYFDLPDNDERGKIWDLNLSKYGLQGMTVSEGWSGANIRDCCDIAYSLQVSTMEAAKSIVPCQKQDPDGISRLRQLAAGRFLSASYPGAYRLPGASSPAAGRAVSTFSDL